MRVPISFAGLAVPILLAGAAHAAAPHAKTSITLQRPTAVAGTVLPAGTYRLEVDGDPGTARFTQGKRVVAEAPVTVGLERAVYSGNAVHSRTVEGQERLVKIVLAGSGLAIGFPSEAAGSTGGPVAATGDQR